MISMDIMISIITPLPLKTHEHHSRSPPGQEVHRREFTKEIPTSLVTPSTVDTIIQMPWMQLDPNQCIHNHSYGQIDSLTAKLSLSPIQYERTILYPDSDYFIIVDRMEGTEPGFTAISSDHQPTITPTVDTNKTDGCY